MSEPSQEERVKILLVDDRPSNLTAMAALLSEADYEIVTAGSGEEALDRVLRDDFAVILLDVAMPRMDGFETATLIKQRERSRETPIIFISASVADLEHVFQGYTIGAVDYLRKPIDPHALRAKVAVFARLHRQARRIERQARLLEASHARAQSALEGLEARFRRLWESPLIGIVLWRKDGTITDANDAFLAMVGYTRPELAQGELSFRVLEAGGNAHADAQAQRELAAEGAFRTYEKEFISKQGERVAALIGGAWADAERTCIISFALDITERRRSESERNRLVAELRRAVQARDDFLSMAAHELKTPLTALHVQVQGLARAQKKGPIDPARLAAAAQLMERSSTRLGQLIDHLLDVSRLTGGRFTLRPEQVDLVEIVRRVLSRLQDVIQRSGSPIELDAPQPIVGEWDALRMEQVVENLVVNATKYGAGQPIEIVVGGAEHGAWLEIEDHGIGIPPDQIGRIFEKFERMAPMSHYSGFGLGLWIVREIVEAHGGRIDVSSTVGQGTRFVVQLPRHAALRAGAKPEEKQPAP